MAVSRIDELRQRFAEQPRRYFVPLANALREAGAHEEAATLLRAHLAEYPGHLSGFVVLGETLFEAGALADAEEAFERARVLDPGNRVVLRHLGEIASLRGDQAAAREWFGRLRAADPYADDVNAQLSGVLPDALTADAPASAPVSGTPVGEAVPVTRRDEVSAEFSARAIEPPPPAVDARTDAAPEEVAWPPAEGQQAPTSDGAVPFEAAELFEPIDFGSAAGDTQVDGLSGAGTPDTVPEDPVVGLDLPPDVLPPELEAELVGVADSHALEPAAASSTDAGPIDAPATPDTAPDSGTVAPPARAEVTRSEEDVAAGGEATTESLPAAPFQTETMAALLLAQGHREQAVAVYERLVAQRPEDAALAARLSALRDPTGEAPAAEPPPAPTPQPAEAQSLTSEDPGSDRARAALLATAFARRAPELPVAVDVSEGGDADAAARATTPTDLDPLDLDALADLSFDRFFPAEASGGGEPVAATAPASGPAVSGVDDDVGARAPGPTQSAPSDADRRPDRASAGAESGPTEADDAADLARFNAWIRSLRE